MQLAPASAAYPHRTRLTAATAAAGHSYRTRLTAATTAAANHSSSGLPLLQALRAVPGGAQGLLGWTVAAGKKKRIHGSSRQHVPLGTVQQVDSTQPAGRDLPTYHLLRVVQQTVLQPYGFQGHETHLLPLVPDIITAVYPQQQLLVCHPPEGLLELGRRGLLLSFLSEALLPYAPPARGSRPPAAAAGLLAAGARALMQPREMPTQAALLAAGRADLVNLITKVGGFSQAALQLGLRATRRPAGYWDSLEVLDLELDALIAGCWVALPCPEDDAPTDNQAQQQQPQQQQQQASKDVYFYNTATRTIALTLPAELQQLLLPPPPAAAASSPVAHARSSTAAAVLQPSAYQALLDLQEERVMPPTSAIKGVGRWDLHKAIIQHGGYSAVAAELERRQCRDLPPELLTPQGLKAALQELCLQEGWDCQRLPTAQQLRDVDRGDLLRAITQMGGWHAVAQELQLEHCRSTAKAWQTWSVSDLAQQLRVFMAQHTPDQSQHPEPAARERQQQQQQLPQASGSSRLSQLRRHRQQQGGQQQAVLTQPQQVSAQWEHLPTQAQLTSAGRLDLLYSLRQHGYDVVRQHMHLQARYSRPKQKGVLTWPAVEAAVAVGCHSLQEILAHISTNCQPLPVQQQAAAGGWPGRVNCQLLEPAKAAAGVVPVVSREHLQRELKLWVEEGRLVKAMRNCYKLPQQCA